MVKEDVETGLEDKEINFLGDEILLAKDWLSEEDKVWDDL